ncbi:MAG TPA: hypothetical protein VFL82_04435 [Thermomicrobiales bacterium]|nr:hypothetical protein [Thermomicrobiales bacterium]
MRLGLVVPAAGRVIIALLLFLILLPRVVMAQSEDPSMYDHGVAAMVCDHDPGLFGGRDERVPLGCVWQPGVSLELTTSDAQILGKCVTGPGGFCHIPAPFGAAVILREDEATIPAGVVPQQNPIIREVTANGSWIINVPASALATPGADAATLTIHSRFCPAGYAGEDYFNVCHSTPPAYPQTFFLTDADHVGYGYRTGIIDGDGDVTIPNLAPGTYRVYQGLPESVSDLMVYCSRDWNPDDRLPTTTTTWWSPDNPRGAFRTQLTLDPGANVLCDFYAIPAATSQ